MRAIKHSDIRSVVVECFSTDKKLIDTFHIAAGSGLRVCVEKTLEDLDSIKESFCFYKVCSGSSLVGFFGVETTFGLKALTSFFIKPEHRKNKDEFWSLVVKTMNYEPFVCGVYTKNTRAISFLKEKGAEEILSVNNGLVFILENNLCR